MNEPNTEPPPTPTCNDLGETDYETIRVIEGVNRLKQLAPTIDACKTIPEVEKIRLNCQLIQTYAQKRKLDKELVLWAQRCALHCQRRIGEIVLRMKANGQFGTRRKVVFEKDEVGRSNLKKMGIDRTKSSNAQTFAKVPKAEFEEMINENISRTGGINEHKIARDIRQRKRAAKPFWQKASVKRKPFADKTDTYWTQEKQLLEKFTIADLEKLPEFWQTNFAEYLAQRKANLEKANGAFASNEQTEQSCGTSA